jgi:2-dehydro-3-deoxygalactonokinase
MMTTDPAVAFLAVDWGSTRLRVSAVAENGSVVRGETLDVGILSLDRAGQRERLRAALRPFRTEYPAVPVVAAGMLGSRNGMIETTPVRLPATVADAARAMVPVVVDDATPVLVCPGLADTSADPIDLIRGEEVQVFGWLADHPDRDRAVLILPGTHSKWVEVQAGAVTRFRTFLTGELYARLLETPSLRPDAELDRDDANGETFAAGVHLAGRPGGLLHHLFAARSHMLANRLTERQMADLISGVVIGDEIDGALQAGLLTAGSRPVVIADDNLARRYHSAFASAGIDAEIEHDAIFGRGIASIAACRSAGTANSASRDRQATRSMYEESHDG